MNKTQAQGAYNPYSWFTEFQRDCVFRNGIVPEWFHGVISRKTAEEMLTFKPIGNFLIRVSESRIGYTLSYRATDRCRHFMIDVLKDNNYKIVGEDTSYRSLQDLVKYHQRVPISPFNEKLTGACGQVSNEQTNYAELLYPKRQPVNTTLLPKTNSDTNLKPMEDIPCALPHLPNTFIHPASPLSNTTKPPVPPNSHLQTRLYPCLETMLNPCSTQSPSMVDYTAKPLPVPRMLQADSKGQPDQPAALPTKTPAKPPRKIKSSAAPEGSAESRAVCTNTAQTRPIESQQELNPTQQKSQAVKSVVSNLTHFKNKFLKKKECVRGAHVCRD
ncbi:hypothetical protein UPYG_G00036310 [Umbra pygmaea]|uniref:SH2 domain-containing protein n=1 Tax=Umbra pygmaea TaxID=75934 RepID=A0ABD0YCY5_UMBPY